METIARKKNRQIYRYSSSQKTVIGSKVVNAQNENLGKIEDHFTSRSHCRNRRWSRPDRLCGLILWRLSWNG